MPAGLPIAADGSGNFWVLDLTPDTVEVAPVFFHCHDAPVLLYQAPDLATFLDEVVKKYVPPHASRSTTCTRTGCTTCGAPGRAR